MEEVTKELKYVCLPTPFLPHAFFKLTHYYPQELPLIRCELGLTTTSYPAAETVKNHIKLLHDYNDIRDVGQGLVGMIADNRGVRIGELYEEFGVGLKD